MGNYVAKRDHNDDHFAKNADRVVEEKLEIPAAGAAPAQECEDNDVFADVNQNNGTSSKGTAVTDSTSTEDPKNNGQQASATDTRPHLVRLFSRDAPGREDNTFKDRPSESDELQTIQEDSAPESDLMSSQKLSRHGSKPMASASTFDRSRHGYGAHGRYRDSGFLDSLGRFFGGDRHVPRKGKDVHLSRSLSRSGYLSSSPQRSPYYGHGRYHDDNAIVHFFRNIVTPRTPPPSQPRRGWPFARYSWSGETHKHCYGGSSPRYWDHHKSHKGYKDYHGQGTLSRIFRLGGRDSRSSSPMARR